MRRGGGRLGKDSEPDETPARGAREEGLDTHRWRRCCCRGKDTHSLSQSRWYEILSLQITLVFGSLFEEVGVVLLKAWGGGVREVVT